MSARNKWQFWIDRGGTFTDVVALRPDGRLETAKLLSANPEQYADAAAEGIRQFMAGSEPGSDPERIEAVKMGTTVATNALLERRGTPTVFVVTKGFRDALSIGRITIRITPGAEEKVHADLPRRSRAGSGSAR